MTLVRVSLGWAALGGWPASLFNQGNFQILSHFTQQHIKQAHRILICAPV